MPATDRKDRLAAALRANLRRRKAQERGRNRPVPDEGGERGDGDTPGLAADGSAGDQPKSAKPA